MAKLFKYQCGECGGLYVLEVIHKGLVTKLACASCKSKYKPGTNISRYGG